MKNITLGILAHVDAGKTTMSEALLYKSGAIRNIGRVDHKDAFLDNNLLERQRGITIFSKQAVFDYENLHVNLLDTPGHVDFSSEMERTLSVLDFAVLIVSASEGVQAHTKTLISLLEKYDVPTFVWINKMDICSKTKAEILDDLSHRMGNCVDFGEYGSESFFESIAVADESALNLFLNQKNIPDEQISQLIIDRKVFPCYFGSALKLEGIDEFLSGLARFAGCGDFRKQSFCSSDSAVEAGFSARVYKITRDENGNRLTHIRIYGGSLKVRDFIGDEKVSQIRVYNGVKYQAVQEAVCGNVYALTGLEHTYAGQGLGSLKDAPLPVLVPAITYGIKVIDGTDITTAFKKISSLSEEDPSLKIVWNEKASEIQAQLMGKIQIEVLEALIKDRFDIAVSISSGKIVYKETIEAPVEGVGHFEPLRHYAEVHLLLEPLPFGSGVCFESACSTDVLDLNWQRLIMTNLAEKQHIGVLTGSPITDMRITVVAGRAHLKHTEGGDFRQATYRAVRQGLMKAKNVLLEPYYDFEIELPALCIGRCISDLKAKYCSFDAPVGNDIVSISGRGPASELFDYQSQLLSYTKGEGRLSLKYAGYFPCHNSDKVIEECGYDALRDVENTSDSVFCSHGSGVNVPWDRVEEFMHIDSGLSFENEVPQISSPKVKSGNIDFDEKQLEDIMLREFGPIKRPQYSKPSYDSDSFKRKNHVAKKEHLIVDGYNVIFAWDDLKELASISPNAAADSLCDILADFAAYRECGMTVVFDAYKVRFGKGSKTDYDGINVVYTKEGQTADFYIEGLVKELGSHFNVRIISSDAMIQLAALRAGVLRSSSSEFKNEIDLYVKDIRHILEKYRPQQFKLADVVRKSAKDEQ